MIKTVRSIVAALSAIALFAGGAAAQSVDLTGAGATFPYPIYSKWFSDYAQRTGVKINYRLSALAAASGSSRKAPLISAPRTAR